jgi:cellulose synthase/poly-beta-1,6-N-acetylglucosamine synthase-like glycosyltransferase
MTDETFLMVFPIVFWLSITAFFYPYLVYPIIVKLLGKFFPHPVHYRSWEPKVTILIPAYNEVSCIRATIENKLALDYPKSKLQIIVISDGSNDGTDEIVCEFSNDCVELLRREMRNGKADALNQAVSKATGEILVFSDANSLFASDAIRLMAENLADENVGYVTGGLTLLNDSGNVSGQGGNAYIRYEDMLRDAETRLLSIIGVNGGVDAIRRNLYVEIPRHLITDFVLPLSVIAAGKRVVFDRRIRSTEIANSEVKSEFAMRVRVALRAQQGIAYMRQLLNPFRFPLISFCLTSHKVMRYYGFLFLIIAFLANCALAISSSLYFGLLLVQVFLYILATISIFKPSIAQTNRIMSSASYLLMTNVAFAIASFKFFRGDKMAVWKPRAG